MFSHGWPFADSARDMDVAGCRIFSGLIHAFRLADDSARCPALNSSSLTLLVVVTHPARTRSHFRQRGRRPRDFVRPHPALCPRLHRADTYTRASHQVSARFSQCPLPDSTFSARSIHYRTPLHRLRGMLSLIPSVANCRDRHGFRRALPLNFVGSLRSWIVCSRCSKK